VDRALVSRDSGSYDAAMTSETISGSEASPAGPAAFASAQWSLGEQFRSVEGLDSKAERLFGGAVAVVGLFGAIVTLAAGR
jgi:hypothetical protein